MGVNALSSLTARSYYSPIAIRPTREALAEVRFAGGQTAARGAAIGLFSALALAVSVLLMGSRDASNPPAPTVPAQTSPLAGLRPLSLDIAELNRTANAMGFNEYEGMPSPDKVSLSQAQTSYRRIADPWTYRLLNTLYQAERDGKIYQPKPGEDKTAAEPELKPGVVYRYLAGFTKPGEEVPDLGHPGTFRVAKRMLIDGHQMDVCEAWEVTPKGKGVETRLVDIRTHFTSELELEQRTNGIVFNRFTVTPQHQLTRANEFLPDNTLSPETKHDPIRSAPGQCMACHIGLVGHHRTEAVLEHHFPRLPNEGREDLDLRIEKLAKPAFNLDTFLPNRVYHTPPAEQLGLKEWMAKAPGATPELAQQLTTPRAFAVPKALMKTLERLDKRP